MTQQFLSCTKNANIFFYLSNLVHFICLILCPEWIDSLYAQDVSWHMIYHPLQVAQAPVHGCKLAWGDIVTGNTSLNALTTDRWRRLQHRTRVSDDVDSDPLTDRWILQTHCKSVTDAAIRQSNWHRHILLDRFHHASPSCHVRVAPHHLLLLTPSVPK